MHLLAGAVLATVATLCPALALAEAPVIEISGANFRPMPLAVAPPLVQDASLKEAAAELDSALLFDLSAAGIFQVLDRKSFLADAQEGLSVASIQFARWLDVGAEGLLKTSLRQEGGNLEVELRLFTVASGKEDFKHTLKAPAGAARRLAHQMADTLFRFYTREPGVFGSRIAFVKKTGAGKEVWMGDWDGRSAAPVSTGSIALLPAVTPDGSAVAFTSYRRNKPEVFVQAPAGQPKLLVSEGEMVTGIAYSRDGKRIAYSVAEDDKGTQIWVANADGSGARALTDSPYFINSSPTWSPDGKRIAFVSNRGGSPQIYVMTAEGTEVKRLTFKGNYNQTPDWSPRGDLIAFTARDERNAFDLFTVNVGTGEIRRLTQDEGNNEEPAFSPNGRLILFSSDRTGSMRLYVMTVDGENQLALPMGEGTFLNPAWGPLPRN